MSQKPRGRMSDLTDAEILRKVQYKDSRNLDARIALHRDYSVNQYPFSRWEFDHYLDLPNDASVLEVGCGPATLWSENLERIPNDWTVTLSDFSPGMLATAEEKLGNHSSRFHFREVDVQSIPFDDASLDAVIANHMLYHVPDLPAALGEIRRVLKPAGRLFAVTNGDGHLRELRELRERAAIDEVNQDWLHISSLPFNLGNGEALLAPHFPFIETDLYEDALVVVEAQPLIDYLASAAREPWTEQTRRAMSDFLTAELEQQGGEIRIGKETGMFIAHA